MSDNSWEGMDLYLMDENKNVYKCKDYQQWVEKFGEGLFGDKDEFKVARDNIYGCHISTVFLGVNAGTLEHPQYFETLVFGGKFDQYLIRYPNFQEAMRGHGEVLKIIGSKTSFLDKLLYMLGLSPLSRYIYKQKY